LLHGRVGREGFGRGRLGRSRKRPDEIAAAHDADEAAVAYHRKSPDLSVVEDRGGSLDPERGTDDQGGLRHDVRHGQPDDLLVAARQVFRVLEEEAPPRRDLRPALPEDQVAVADDADDSLVGIDHRQAAHAVREHQPRGFSYRGLRAHRDHPTGHDVFDRHDATLVSRMDYIMQ